MTNHFNTALPNNPPLALDIPVYRQILPQIGLELRRARRYERPMSLVLLSPGELVAENTGGPRESRPRSVPLLYVLLGSFLRNTLRETDLLASMPERLLYTIFLPECREEDATLAVHRLSEAFHQIAGCRMRSGTAEFPRDGLTLDALFAFAKDAWSGAEPHRMIGPVQQEASHG